MSNRRGDYRITNYSDQLYLAVTFTHLKRLEALLSTVAGKLGEAMKDA